jgi:hypothetical protein
MGLPHRLILLEGASARNPVKSSYDLQGSARVFWGDDNEVLRAFQRLFEADS